MSDDGLALVIPWFWLAYVGTFGGLFAALLGARWHPTPYPNTPTL